MGEKVLLIDPDTGLPYRAGTVTVEGTDVATQAKQDTGNTSLASIDTKLSSGILTCTASITRPADTNAYTAGDALSNSTSAPTAGGGTFTSAARASGKSVILTDLLVVSSAAAVTPMQGILHIFDTAPTAINDNAAFSVSDAQMLTCVARVPFTLVTRGANSGAHVQNINAGILTVGSANLRFLVEVTNAYTPESGETLSFRAKFLPVD